MTISLIVGIRCPVPESNHFWTRKAAKQALWVVAQMTPQKAAEAFQRVGSMQPSKSSLDRLPKLVSEEWKVDREVHEAALRDALLVPEGTVSIAVSLDGVLAPIDGGNRPVDVRNAAAREGRRSRPRSPPSCVRSCVRDPT